MFGIPLMALRIAKGLISEQLAKGICSKTALRNCEIGNANQKNVGAEPATAKRCQRGRIFLKFL